MERFEIGEVAAIRGLIVDIELNGSDCEVLSGPKLRTTRNERLGITSTAIRIAVKLPNGDVRWIKPHQLRKKRPPTPDEAECRQAMLDCIERAKRGQEIEA